MTQVGSVVSIADRLAITLCLVIHGLVILGTYLVSSSVSEKLRGKGTVEITRLGGIILLSLVFEIFTDGLKVLLPGLG